VERPTGCRDMKGATTDLVQASRPIKFLPLDVPAMTQAVARFAPDVAITSHLSNRAIAELSYHGARRWTVPSVRRIVISFESGVLLARRR